MQGWIQALCTVNSRQRKDHSDRELPVQECALALRPHLPQHQQHGQVKRRMRRAWTSRPK